MCRCTCYNSLTNWVKQLLLCTPYVVCVNHSVNYRQHIWCQNNTIKCTYSFLGCPVYSSLCLGCEEQFGHAWWDFWVLPLRDTALCHITDCSSDFTWFLKTLAMPHRGEGYCFKQYTNFMVSWYFTWYFSLFTSNYSWLLVAGVWYSYSLLGLRN